MVVLLGEAPQSSSQQQSFRKPELYLQILTVWLQPPHWSPVPPWVLVSTLIKAATVMLWTCHSDPVTFCPKAPNCLRRPRARAPGSRPPVLQASICFVDGSLQSASFMPSLVATRLHCRHALLLLPAWWLWCLTPRFPPLPTNHCWPTSIQAWGSLSL